MADPPGYLTVAALFPKFFAILTPGRLAHVWLDTL